MSEFVCDKCNKSFKKQINLTLHIKNKACIKTKCEYCLVVFETDEQVFDHYVRCAAKRDSEKKDIEDIFDKLAELDLKCSRIEAMCGMNEDEIEELRESIEELKKNKNIENGSSHINNGTIINNNITLIGFNKEDIKEHFEFLDLLINHRPENMLKNENINDIINENINKNMEDEPLETRITEAESSEAEEVEEEVEEVKVPEKKKRGRKPKILVKGKNTNTKSKKQKDGDD
jgi:predicted oxidoreductase